MKKQTLFLIALATFFLSETTFGQVVQNAKEAKQNRQQIHKGKANLQRDKAELKAFNNKVMRLEAAFADRDLKSAQIIKKDLVYTMQKEIEQSALKSNQARNEVRQSRQEVNSERRELRTDKRDIRNSKADKRDDRRDYARDRANKRDDQIDLRDDIRDANASARRIQNQRKILDEIKGFQYSDKTPHEKATSILELLNQFSTTMKADIHATYGELNEDKRERREDVRERRDDKNERRERHKN